MKTVAFVARGHHPSASDYFHLFPGEPVQPSGLLQIDKVVPIPSVTVYSLLKAIADYKPKNVITVSHGFPGGLSIPLTSRTKKPLGVSETEVLSQCADGSMTVKEAASRLDLRKGDIALLKEVVLRVRRLRLDKLVMRACILGQHLDVLEGLRQLFGADTACAPNVFDAFARVNLGSIGKAPLTKFLELSDVVSVGSEPNRFAWRAESTGSLTFKFQAAAESPRAVTDWMTRSFPKGRYGGGGSFAIHGQVPDPSFIRKPPLIFPLERDYRNHLIMKSGSN